jgi:hypothetical protein
MPKVPDIVAQGLKKAFGAPADAPLDPFLHHTFWRCMDGQNCPHAKRGSTGGYG